MKNLKKIIFIFIFSFFSLLFSDEILNNLNTSWSKVLSGKVVSEPIVTSYGFTLITDAKLISTYSNTGKLLWEKPLKRYRDAKLFSFPNDFILLISENNKKLTLLNPSGYELWSKQLNFSLNSAPLCGYDGRFFVKGNSEIECIGISGITKWNYKSQNLSKIPLQELPDGSIIAFLQNLDDGKSKGIRISPFCEILEEITFSGQIIKSSSCDDGIFLIFSDGSAGFFSLDKNLSQNKWVLQTEKPSDLSQIEKTEFLVCPKKQDVFYVIPYKDQVAFFKISTKDGKIKNSFIIRNINGLELTKLIYNENGIFISDNSKAFFYNDEGLELWSARFPQKNRKNEWNYLIFSNENYLIFCQTNWTLNSYRISQNLNKNLKNQKNKNYNSYYEIDTSKFDYIFRAKLEGDFATEKRIEQLQKGFYAKDEIVFVSETMSACEVLKSELNGSPKTNRNGQSIFELDSIGTGFLLRQISLFSTNTFESYEAIFLTKMQNKSFLSELLNGIKNFGYDSEGKILSSLEQLASKTSSRDEKLIEDICDSVFSICRFMGKPAFNSKGKNILQNFLFPNYSSNTKKYARETLKKISELEL